MKKINNVQFSERSENLINKRLQFRYMMVVLAGVLSSVIISVVVVGDILHCKKINII